MIFENDDPQKLLSTNISEQINSTSQESSNFNSEQFFYNNDEFKQTTQNVIDSNKTNQFNRYLTLEDIEKESLSMDEKLQNAITAMNKPINHRNLIEQRAIIKIIENNKFLQKVQKYNKNLLNLIANCIDFESIQKGKPVFQYGDRSDKFFIILKGKVSVLVPKTKNELAQQKEEMKNDSFQYSMESPIRRKNTDVGENLYLNFPNTSIKQKIKVQETNSEHVSPRLQTMDSYGDEMSSPLSLIKKKSNFSMCNSDGQKGLNKDIKRISQDLNLQLIKKNSFQFNRKKIDQNQFFDEDRISPEIPLSRSEVLNWKQYFLIENDLTIMKYNHIKFLSEGDTFGDFGLLTRKPRSSSILAVQDTLLLTIQKADYEQLIREISYNKMEKRVKFFEQCLKFEENKLKQDQMNSIVLDFSTKTKLNKGWNLFQEGDPTDCLYLIKKGEIQLSKKMKYVYNDITQNYEFNSDIEIFSQNEPLSPTIKEKGKIRVHQIDFVIVSQSELIGSEDLFYNKKYRSYSAKCLSDVVVYSIKKSQLLKLISEYYYFKIVLQKYAYIKYENHNERIITIAESKKSTIKQNKQILIKQYSSSSQKEIVIPLNSEKNGISLFKRKPSMQTSNSQIQGSYQPQNHYLSQNSPIDSRKIHLKSNSISFQNKTNPISPMLNSINLPTNQSQQQIKLFQDQMTISQPQMHNNYQMNSLRVIEDVQASINQPVYLTNSINNPQMKQQKQKERKTLHTQPIMNEKDDSEMQYIDELASNFEESNILKHLKTNNDDSQNEQTTFQNQFWFDQNMKTQLVKKIVHGIKEKDPFYIKKVRQTFKGNMEIRKYGTLDKKLSKLISSKPKLFSNALNGLPNIDKSNDQIDSPLLPTRKESEDLQNFKNKQKLHSPINNPSTQTPYYPSSGQQTNNNFNTISNNNKKKTIPLLGNSFGNLQQLKEEYFTNTDEDCYELKSARNNQRRHQGQKSNSVQLSPFKFSEKSPVKERFLQPLVLEPTTSIESQDQVILSNKLSFNNFNIPQQEPLSERSAYKTLKLNKSESSNTFLKNKLLTPREPFNSSSNSTQNRIKIKKEKMNASNQESLVINNNTFQDKSTDSQKLFTKTSLLNFYQSNKNNKKSNFDIPHIDQIN